MLWRAGGWWVLALVLAAHAHAGIFTLRQGRDGYSGTSDTWLDGGSGDEDENNGGDSTLHVRYSTSGDRVALLRFNLANQLPAGAAINAATASLYYYDRWSFAGTEQFDVDFYRCLNDWTEGNGVGQGGTSRSGASWYYRHAYPSTVQWYSGGAHGIGNDRRSPADASITITNETPFGWLTWSSSALRDSVAAWHANPSSNYGWVIDYSYSNDSNGILVWSREGGGASYSPGLEISYTGGIYWTGSESGAWDVNSTANWRATTGTNVKARYGNGDSPIFDDSASGTKAITIQGGGVTIGSMTVNTTGTYSFSGGAIAGAGGSLTKAGTGTLVLANSSNTYTGGTSINGGTLRLGANNVIPDYAVSVASATLDLNGYSDTIGVLGLSSGTVSGNGTLTLGGNVTSSGTSAISGGMLALGGHRSFDVSGALTIGSAITGPGHSLAKEGSGTLILSNSSNSYSGGTYVNGGTLRLGASNVIPDQALSISNATLDLNGYSDTIGVLGLSSGTVSGNGTLTLEGNVASSGSSSIAAGTVALGGSRAFDVSAGSSLTIAGAIAGPGSSLTKSGDGAMFLSGTNANTYDGATTVLGGMLVLGKSPGLNAVPGDLTISNGAVRLAADENIADTASVTIGPSSQLILHDTALAGHAETIGALAGGGKVDFGSLPSMTPRLIVDSASDSAFSGTITGAGNLAKRGAATLTLGGTCDYTGTTSVEGGTLRVTGSLTGTASVTVGPGATLDVEGSVSGNLTIRGTLTGIGAVGQVTMEGGATLAPGASPGALRAQRTAWRNGGNYNWQVHDAAGNPGIGYDVFLVEGLLDLTEAAGFNINLWSLSDVSPDVSGPCINFDPGLPAEWTLARAAGGIVGFDPLAFNLHVLPNNGTDGFANDLAGGAFSLDVLGNDLVLRFNPSSSQVIPEPGTAAILALGLLAALRRRARRA